jgi:hypothetical protein
MSLVLVPLRCKAVILVSPSVWPDVKPKQFILLAKIPFRAGLWMLSRRQVRASGDRL